ncbi:MAG: hypothetical protein GXP05_13770 [Alphaproteobacteria bacterium]|nr:hypothetical protein [Alphaproteobacteria bacterium]
MTRGVRLGLIWIGLSALAGAAEAEGLSLRTAFTQSNAHAIASSLDTFLGFQNRVGETANARLMWDKNLGDFKLEIQSDLSFVGGDNIAYAAALAPYVPAAPPATYFNLTQTWQSSTASTITNRIERLNVTYSAPSFVLRAGRQAITWGNGMVFHPADIVAPFAPNAVDTAYKPGADMVYGQYLFDNGADIQAIAVPRANVAQGPIRFDASTYAIRAHVQLGSLETSLMFARDRGDSVASLGFSGALGGASWNAEYVNWTLNGGAVQPSWVVNISNFSSLFGRNIAYFGEFYHNGFGVDAPAPLSALPASLTKRISTGQVFVAGRNFLALGAQVQVTPDLTISPNAIISFNDHSALAGFSANYTLSDNTNMVLSYTQPIGTVGTEFGGRETATSSGIYVAPTRSLSLQLVRFF